MTVAPELAGDFWDCHYRALLDKSRGAVAVHVVVMGGPEALDRLCNRFVDPLDYGLRSGGVGRL